MLIGDLKVLVREAIQTSTRENSGLERLFVYLDDKWELPDSIEWLRLALAIRDVYQSAWFRAFCLVSGTLILRSLLEKLIYSIVRSAELRRLREGRQEERQAMFTKLMDKIQTLQLSTEEVQSITALDLPTLAQKLQIGELKPVQVLHAYQAKAMEAHERTNCVTEIILEAEQWAEELDGVPKDERGPLFGVPVSLKENYSLQGHDTTEGSTRLIGNYYETDCVVVRVLRSLGAVPFVRTNMPQFGMSHESGNPIYGTTLNPYNMSRSPGGSSSGEGALLALGGAPFGMGSDTGGSIRCPAAWCGLCALKPTYGRISAKGRPDFNGQTILQSVSCPVAQNMASLVCGVSALCSSPLMHSLDPYSPPLGFDQQILTDQRPLKIGMFTYDGFCQAVPACERVVNEARKILLSKGHEVVEWSPPSPEKAFWYSVTAMAGDGGKKFMKEASCDKLDPSAKEQAFAYRVPQRIRCLAAACLKFFNPIYASMIKLTLGINSVTDWWDLTKEIQEYRESVFASWHSQQLDAVICPAFASPALPRNSGYALYASGYCMMFNVLDFPAGVVPFGTYTTKDSENLKNHYPEDTWIHRGIKKCMLAGSEGLPLSVQCASLPWQEATCLRVLQDLEQGLTHPVED